MARGRVRALLGTSAYGFFFFFVEMCKYIDSKLRMHAAGR